MAFQLLLAVEADVPDMVTIYQDSFADDRIFGRAMSKVPRDIRRAYDIARFTGFFTTEKIYGAQLFKVVETETNTLVGFAKWKFPCRLTKEQEAQWEATAARRGPYPEGTNEPLQDDILRPLWANRFKWINHEKTFHLHILATAPSHQRRGIGTMLLAHGLAAADAAGASTYIEASAKALPLYIRHGWKPVEDILINLDQYGYEGKGWEVVKCMMREPGAGAAVGQ